MPSTSLIKYRLFVATLIVLPGYYLWIYELYRGQPGFILNLVGVSILFGAAIVVIGTNKMNQAVDIIEGFRETTRNINEAATRLKEE